jgi:hypothetical protein
VEVEVVYKTAEMVGKAAVSGSKCHCCTKDLIDTDHEE